MMREAKRRGEESSLTLGEKSSTDETVKLWEIAFKVSDALIEYCRTTSRERLLAEAFITRGESLVKGALDVTNPTDWPKLIDLASSSFLEAVDIGKQIGEKWIIFNASANIWNMFVVISSLPSGNSLKEVWLEVFSKFIEALGNTSVQDSTLFAQISSGFATSFEDTAFQGPADPKSKNTTNDKNQANAAIGNNPSSRDMTSFIKLAEDVLSAVHCSKNADFNSLLLSTHNWADIQLKKGTPVANVQLETDDPVLKLFLNLELLSKTKQDKESASVEQTIVNINQVQLVPDVFRTEMFLRIGKYAADMNNRILALGCGKKAIGYLDIVEKLTIDPPEHFYQVSPLFPMSGVDIAVIEF